MFFSLGNHFRRNNPRRSLLIAGVVASLIAVLAGTVAVQSQPAPSQFEAQGGRWERTGGDVGTSVYALTSPAAGSGAEQGKPRQYGVTAWQELLNDSGYEVSADGVYGAKTKAAVAKFQRSQGLEPTGAVGYPTAKALLGGLVDKHAKKVGMPTSTLMCHLTAESNLDAGAVGLNGSDMGVAQISLVHNPGVTTEQAFDVEFAVEYMAERDADAYAKFKNWEHAVVSYNSPARAQQWAATGEPDEVAGNYAHRVMKGC